MGRGAKKTANVDGHQHWRPKKDGGADRDRTCDPHNAIVVLYQLSYDPIRRVRLNLESRCALSKTNLLEIPAPVHVQIVGDCRSS
jgi:hypothetical protein